MTARKDPKSLEKSLEAEKKLQGNIIVACSGWVDSMVLLDSVRKYGNQGKVIVAHVHHWLRESASRDEKIVKEYCEKYDLIFEVIRVDVKKESKKTKTTIEECARNIRRDFFHALKEKYNASYILTAHHGDDQAETILYRIIKWTSITGLGGIEHVWEDYLRPFLSFKKSDLKKYAEENNISFWYDETNEDTSIPRNFLRHDIIGKLTSINPEVSAALGRLSHSARELKEGFDIFFLEIWEKREFSLDWYQWLPLWFQHELLRFLYEKSNGSTHGLSLDLIHELDRFLWTRNGGRKSIKNMNLEKKQGKVFF